MGEVTNKVQAEKARRAKDAIVEAVGQYWDEHGYPPTKVEIAKSVGLGNSTVRRHIQTLVDEGRLTEGDGPRTLRLP